ncbi:MAG: adenylyltransferase/cytidyltransferase family protein [Magnetococcales bacterium]|nr:adenylyltransferase/cytidyltransferase family protein [Magnetococcales bacterium]
MMSSKQLSFEQLAEKARQLRKQGKQVVLCHGAFDLLHPGHIRHLARARKEGDILLVTLTGDRFINKGPSRPVFQESLRAESIAALASVDHVAIHHDATAVSAIQGIKPHVYVKGSDYQDPEQDITGNIMLEKNAVEAVGGRIFFTDEIQFSSSSLINEHFDVFSPLARRYLAGFRQKHDATSIIEQVQRLSSLKVLVVGEAIVDEYCWATPMGQTGKSGHILSAKFDSIEQFAGGALAIANHLAGFAGEVTLLTGLGRGGRHEPFIRSKLDPKIITHFHYFEDAPTLVKRRFVDPFMNKLFEVYYYDEDPMTPEVESPIRQWIRAHAAEYDLVLVPDYGNGFISVDMARDLSETARFLAVNTQINSGNRGYHVITRYPRVDFTALNEPEVRLAAHNRQDSVEKVGAALAARVGAKNLAVTLGMDGALFLEQESERIHHVPALSTKVVDRIGAGDAFLCLAGLALAGGLEPEVAAFLGSSAAALDVQIVCNREPVLPVNLFKYINTLLK